MANYKSQANLLLTVLPEVAKEECFALHGGTAINLFVREMPRLSVDIDLTYIPLEDRAFLVNFENGTPNWTVYDFSDFPAVQWKLQNVNKLKETNAEKHSAALKKLKDKFDTNS